MIFTDPLKMISEAFATSPSLGAIVVLVLWLLFCWKYRLVTVGRKKSLQDIILKTFALEKNHDSGTTLDTLNTACVLASASKDCTEQGNDSDSTSHTWTVREIFQIYWCFYARGKVITYTTLLLSFSIFCLGFMQLAQPREAVSLLKVANIIGVWTFVPLAMLSLLSVALVLSTTHQLPCLGIKEQKPHIIILFAW